MNDTVAAVFTAFLYLLIAAVVVRSLMSWFPVSPTNPFNRLLYQITEPILGPVRRLLPRTGMIDFSAMLVIVLLYVMIVAVDQARSA